jgi:hypothetical protein
MFKQESPMLCFSSFLTCSVDVITNPVYFSLNMKCTVQNVFPMLSYEFTCYATFKHTQAQIIKIIIINSKYNI